MSLASTLFDASALFDAFALILLPASDGWFELTTSFPDGPFPCWFAISLVPVERNAFHDVIDEIPNDNKLDHFSC